MEAKREMDIYYGLTEECKQKVLNDAGTTEALKELLSEGTCEGIKVYDEENAKYYFIPMEFYSMGSMKKVNSAQDELQPSYLEKNNIDIFINGTEPNPRYATRNSMGIVSNSRRTVSKNVATILFNSIIEVSESDLTKLEKDDYSNTHIHYNANVNFILEKHRSHLLKHFGKMIDSKND